MEVVCSTTHHSKDVVTTRSKLGARPNLHLCTLPTNTCRLPTTTTPPSQSKRKTEIMPTFVANDGVSLSYESHGSALNQPLVLVNQPCPFASSHDLVSRYNTAAWFHRLWESLQAQRIRSVAKLSRSSPGSSLPRRLRKATLRLSCLAASDGFGELH